MACEQCGAERGMICGQIADGCQYRDFGNPVVKIFKKEELRRIDGALAWLAGCVEGSGKTPPQWVVSEIEDLRRDIESMEPFAR